MVSSFHGSFFQYQSPCHPHYPTETKITNDLPMPYLMADFFISFLIWLLYDSVLCYLLPWSSGQHSLLDFFPTDYCVSFTYCLLPFPFCICHSSGFHPWPSFLPDIQTQSWLQWLSNKPVCPICTPNWYCLSSFPSNISQNEIHSQKQRQYPPPWKTSSPKLS